jgi:hypothetical protein
LFGSNRPIAEIRGLVPLGDMTPNSQLLGSQLSYF